MIILTYSMGYCGVMIFVAITPSLLRSAHERLS
nr:MAG TPA_asm: hypothetical protein [Caudoviricetes sp.]